MVDNELKTKVFDELTKLDKYNKEYAISLASRKLKINFNIIEDFYDSWKSWYVTYCKYEIIIEPQLVWTEKMEALLVSIRKCSLDLKVIRATFIEKSGITISTDDIKWKLRNLMYESNKEILA